MSATVRPITLLISAMGGEGGGVLTDWIVNAATAHGIPVQSTSIPGVAQRTGATSYYVEIYPTPWRELDGREPVLSLYPGIGDIDLMVATELVEVGRAMEKGFVHPERTLLLGSTHRVFTINEKMAMGDSRYDGRRIVDVAADMAKRVILFDVEKAAREAGSVPNSVILGAIAGSGVLPIPPEVFEEGIRAEGKAVEANLSGFAKGLAYGRGEVTDAPLVAAEAKRPHYRPRTRQTALQALEAEVRATYPEALHAVLLAGVARTLDYQDARYAHLYLGRVAAVFAAEPVPSDYRLTNETARLLALWMTYEDVIRVAQLKTRRERFERVRAEVGAKSGEPLRIVEFLKPGVDEFASIMPPFLARPFIAWAEKRGLRDRLNVGMYVHSTSVAGFLKLWGMAKLRYIRRVGYRFGEEQAMIEHWLDRVRRAVAIDYAFATEVAELARLVKGYGDTHRRGVGNFRQIMDNVVEPAVAGRFAPLAARPAVVSAREAALSDPEGTALGVTLGSLAEGTAAQAAAQ